MNWLEQFAITIVLGILQQVIKDPTKKAALQTVLVGVANDIYASYGLVPPAAPADPAAPLSVKSITAK
jgi:hypothetical protein